jgi:hypothetical protein
MYANQIYIFFYFCLPNEFAFYKWVEYLEKFCYFGKYVVIGNGYVIQ